MIMVVSDEALLYEHPCALVLGCSYGQLTVSHLPQKEQPRSHLTNQVRLS